MFHSNLQTPAVRRLIGVGIGWGSLFLVWAAFVALTMKVNVFDILANAANPLEHRAACYALVIAVLGLVHFTIAFLSIARLPRSRR